MQTAVNMWPLLGVAVIVLGFLLRLHPVLVVVAACFTTGFAAFMPVESLLASLGTAFVKTRNLPMIYLLPLAAIGLLERFGLREHAQSAIARVRSATAGRLLIVYLAVREVSAALGLTSLGGHPNMVRPVVAPMAEGAAETQLAAHGAALGEVQRQHIRAMAAATDNVGLFFGEDIFVAFGAIVLMQTVLRAEGIEVDPLHMALWGIPTAICAFIIHAWRLNRLDHYLRREAAKVIIRVEYFYYLLGIMLALVGLMSFGDRSNPRRWTTGIFWTLYAMLYLVGERLPPSSVGLAMIVMALLAGFGGVRSGKPDVLSDQARRDSAARLRHKLFIPALVIPVVTMAGATLFKDVRIGELFVLDQKHLTLVSLGCAAVIAVGVACWLTRTTPLQAGRESRRLVDAMSWAIVLPHMLAVLGLLFSEAGVGKAVAQVTTTYIGLDSKLVAVAVYCIGMALFTIVMGNGFAAFPVMAGGVGVPVLLAQFGGNPAVMAAIGMFSAYCGTLMTPMAANFNIIPAALLDLSDRNAVIKAQIPTALPLLGANIVLLYFLL